MLRLPDGTTYQLFTPVCPPCMLPPTRPAPILSLLKDGDIEANPGPPERSVKGRGKGTGASFQTPWGPLVRASAQTVATSSPQAGRPSPQQPINLLHSTDKDTPSPHTPAKTSGSPLPPSTPISGMKPLPEVNDPVARPGNPRLDQIDVDMADPIEVEPLQLGMDSNHCSDASPNVPWDAVAQWRTSQPLAPHAPKLSDESVQCLQATVDRPIQILLWADAPDPRFPIIFTPLDHSSLDPSRLHGLTSLFYPPILPFQDQPPVFSYASWANFFKEVLTSGHADTTVVIALPARSPTADLHLLPVIDRRLELGRLRRWLVQIFVMPSAAYLNDDELSFTAAPVSIYVYRATSSFARLPPPTILPLPSPATATWSVESDDLNVHILMDGPSEMGDSRRPMSAVRWLMTLNRFSSDDTSSAMLATSILTYPTSCLPRIQRSSPNTTSIAHFFLPSHLLPRVLEDTPALSEMGIRWIPIHGDNAPRLVIISHNPPLRQNAPRHDAVEVRDSILLESALASHFERIVLFSRFDVLAELKMETDLATLAVCLRNLDNLQLADASQHLHISAPRGGRPRAHPPDILAYFPPRFSPNFVLRNLASVAPVLHHLPLPQPGLMRLTFSSALIARLLCGASFPCPDGGVVRLTSGSSQDDIALSQNPSLPPKATLEDRLRAIRAIDAPPPSLNATALAALPGNGPCLP